MGLEEPSKCLSTAHRRPLKEEQKKQEVMLGKGNALHTILNKKPWLLLPVELLVERDIRSGTELRYQQDI